MFKVEGVRVHPAKPNSRTRRRSSKSYVYFWPKGETIMDNLLNRRTRPFNDYRRLLPEVYTQLGVTDASRLTARWSQKAGCSCGCSPGFVVEGYDANLRRVNVHVDVVAA